MTAPAARVKAGRRWRRGAVPPRRWGSKCGIPAPTDFEYGKDWSVVAGGRGAPPLEPFDAKGNLVFAGNGYVIHKTSINPYQGIDVHGKIIVVAGLPPNSPRSRRPAGAVAAAARIRWANPAPIS